MDGKQVDNLEEKNSIPMADPEDQHTSEGATAKPKGEKEKGKEWITDSMGDLIKGVNNLSCDIGDVNSQVSVKVADVTNQLSLMTSQIASITKRLVQIENVVGKIHSNLTMGKEEVSESEAAPTETPTVRRLPVNWLNANS